jgi:multiple sugar transport system permease protein
VINAELIFFAGVLCLWGGGLLLLNALFKGIRWALAPAGERGEIMKTLRGPLIVGAVLFVIGALLPTDPGRPPGTGVRIPLTWLMLSFPGWLALAAWFVTGSRLIQAWIALTPKEKIENVKSAGGWLVAGGLLWAWNISLKEPTAILKGAIFVQPLTLFAFLVLACAAVAGMAWTEKALKSKGAAARAGTTLMLLVGCIIFGFPFFWLLLTSFKEERDLAMTDGIMWVPKVQLTHPFDDPKRPLAEAKYLGRTVQATILEKLPNGQTMLEIERPYGLLGRRFEAESGSYRPIPRDALVWTFNRDGKAIVGYTREERDNGNRILAALKPPEVKGQIYEVTQVDAKPYRRDGLRWQNYTEALEWMPLETGFGLRYLQNTMVLVVMSMIGTLLSCSFVAYGFSRLNFPGRDLLFGVMLATMMLPGAVTMLPSFLIFRSLGWFDTLKPIWVPAFFAGAFNVFLINQFFKTIPMELEDAAKIDGCSYIRTYWQVMMPLITPALAAIAIWTFMGAWNNFMGPLIYVSSPENMPLAYAVQLFNSERGGSSGLMMAFGTMATIPVLVLFFLAQRWFIEGVQLSGLGGR